MIKDIIFRRTISLCITLFGLAALALGHTEMASTALVALIALARE